MTNRDEAFTEGPEGVIVFHSAANLCFKKTLEKDEEPKTRAALALAPTEGER